jgi:predicted HicB family RNase H-like nuclease
MTYKGYYGVVQYDDEAKIFHGEVINTRTVITFQGTTVDEIETAFRDSVDDYLDWCKERNKEPEKPFSGRFVLRLSPDLHRKLNLKAKMSNNSLNSFNSMLSFLPSSVTSSKTVWGTFISSNRTSRNFSALHSDNAIKAELSATNITIIPF